MSSSTSSSDDSRKSDAQPAAAVPRRGPVYSAWRIAIALVAVLFGQDLVVRYFLLGQSADFVNIATFPQRSDRLLHAPGKSLAVLGNSAVYHGVDGELLGERLAAHGAANFHCETFPADNAAIPEWYAIPQRYFWRSGGSPDVIVVCFFHDQLADCHPVEIGRLAHWFAVWEDWPVLMERSVTTTNERGDFLLSSVWLSYAVRSRLRERVIGAFLPDYKEFSRQLNNVQRRQAEYRHPLSAPPVRSYDLLRGLIARAHDHGARLIFVAFPRRPGGPPSESSEYALDDAALGVIRGAGMEFIDLRRIDGLTAAMYRDFIHMTPEGQQLFTRVLGQRLALLLKQGQK